LSADRAPQLKAIVMHPLDINREPGIMKERDIGALIVGVILGGVSTDLVFMAAAWFGHVGMFIICGLLFTLIVSLLAEQKIILLGLVPNLVMTLCLTVYFLFLLPDIPEWFDVLWVALTMLRAAITLALVVSVPIYFLRKNLGKEDKVHHVFSRDA
jgi:uncharacterized protein (DUF486 family)